MLGSIPERITDRYIDSSIALGVADGRQWSRNELMEFAYTRELLREQAFGREPDKNALRQKAGERISRLYRFTVVDPTDARYLGELIGFTAYINRKLHEGYTTVKLLSFFWRPSLMQTILNT